MAKYRVLRVSFIDNVLQQEGAVIEYEGLASDNLELIEPETDPAPEPAVEAKGKTKG